MSAGSLPLGEVSVRPEPVAPPRRGAGRGVPDSVHVGALGLDVATDREIWDYAGEHGYLIVSKDADFRSWAFLLGPPPKAVWLRIGNGATAVIADALREGAEVIARFAASDEEALLVLPTLDR